MTVEPQNRATNGQFLPGTVANPGGRPKGLSQMVRGALADGQTLLDFYVSVFSRTHPDKRFHAPRYVMEAAQWLSDRGWGRAVATVDLSESVEGGLDLAHIPLYAARVRAILEGLSEVMPGALPEGDGVPDSVRSG